MWFSFNINKIKFHTLTFALVSSVNKQQRVITDRRDLKKQTKKTKKRYGLNDHKVACDTQIPNRLQKD